MKEKIFSSGSRLNSLGFAARGIVGLFRNEPNVWIHSVASILLLIASFYFDVSRMELIALVIVAGLVWVAEIFNSAIERIMDFVCPTHHEAAGFIKDLAAAAVLFSAILALAVGLLIFIPKIF